MKSCEMGGPEASPRAMGKIPPCFENVPRVVCDQKPGGLALFFSACRAGLEHLEAFYQPSVVPDEFW